MRTRCWASILGGCTNDSKEHYVSKGIWLTNKLYVSGLPWCKDEVKQVGLGSLTARVLCVHHNNALSDTDAEMTRFSDALRDAGSLTEERRAQPPPWPLISFQINGPLLERWFLKTALSIYFQNPISVPWAFPVSQGMLPEYLVRAAFGFMPVIEPVGIYRAVIVGENANPEEVFTCEWQHDEEGRIAAAMFSWQRIRFLLWLSPMHTGKTHRVHTKTGEIEESSVPYHLRTIRWRVGDVVSHTIDFAWGAEKQAGGCD